MNQTSILITAAQTFGSLGLLTSAMAVCKRTQLPPVSVLTCITLLGDFLTG